MLGEFEVRKSDDGKYLLYVGRNSHPLDYTVASISLAASYAAACPGRRR